MVEEEKLIEQFLRLGFKVEALSSCPKNLFWQPDMILSKNSHTYIVLVKSNNSIPPSYLNNIAKTPSDKIIPLVIFAQKLRTKTEENDILKLGIGFGYFIRGRLIQLEIRKKATEQTLKKELKKKLRHIDIFVSSKQTGDDGIELKERTLVHKTINLLRDTRNYPFTAHLVEYDNFSLKKLYSHIDSVMENCEWVVVVVEDIHSDTVSYEIAQSIRDKDHENIFMFVKQTRSCLKVWKKEISKVKRLKSKSIKYLPYSELTDLEVTLTKAMNKRMDEICKKEKVFIFI